MPEIVLDMTLAANTIPEGPYLVAITDYKIKDSKSGPYPYTQFTLTVQEGEFAGFKLREIISSSPNAAGITARFFNALGLEILDPATGKPKKQFSYDPSDLLGSKIIVAVKTESSEEYGEQSKVGRYMSEAEFAQLSKADIDAMSPEPEPEPTGRRRK